mmetsp:Transcript_33172/g.43704  ORF Transcript_33172/g.43704 Transcript_33172/m.43704 type:complete len:203 (+) Transcript_33172:48-656(+)
MNTKKLLTLSIIFFACLLPFFVYSLNITPKKPTRSRRGSGYEPKKGFANQSTTALKTLSPNDGKALKIVNKWACIEGCGACCKLDLAGRPHTLTVFEEEEDKSTYMSLIGEDGWCIHFNHEKRGCQIYENRPWFCRVEPDTFNEMYGTEPHEMDEFCTSCCKETIEDEYGLESDIYKKFIAVISALDKGESIEKVELMFSKQ